MSKDTAKTIADATTLRDSVGTPHPIAATKDMPRLDPHCKHFISLSPFLCLSTMSVDGKADVSPRGDPPGFVTVLDDRTILIPDRPGNRRVDSMENIVENPSVGIIFFVPGVEETLRLNGHASIVDEEGLLSAMTVRGHTPKLGIKVEIEAVFFHCAKALKRSRLWDPSSQIDRKDFPTLGQIIHDQRMPETPAKEVERRVEEDYEKDLY